MEDQPIQISKINDFLYSPESLYLHSLYEKFDIQTYKDAPQITGNLNHKAIDTKRYSSSKNWLQGTTVYSSKYEIIGKIDIFDIDTCTLIERKTMIKTLHLGYIYQLFAQMFCLQEMGFTVEHLVIRSLTDNKKYVIELPNSKDILCFKKLLLDMRNFEPLDLLSVPEIDQKSHNSIYGELNF